MESKTAVGHPDDDETCPNCGACKHCGHGGRPQFVPMPYPVYPPSIGTTPRPYTQPWSRPYTQPIWGATWGGIAPNGNAASPSGASYTFTQTANGIYQH